MRLEESKVGNVLVAKVLDGRIAADVAPRLKSQLADYMSQGNRSIVLDLGLPRLDGLTILKRWREEGVECPVLILTARGSWKERVEGIDAGADDYLPKPFRMEELLARARALVRRAGGRAAPQQAVGDLSVDLNRMSVACRGVQPQAGRRQPVVSRPERKAWWTKGSLPSCSASQACAGTSSSRSCRRSVAMPGV